MMTTTPSSPMATPASKPFLQVAGQPIYFEEDWNAGIGGGLWSTGTALARYFDSPHALQQLLHTTKRTTATAPSSLSFLELGSGNGLLSVCWMALVRAALANEQNAIRQHRVVVTDTAEHLPLVRKTLQANSHIVKGGNGNSSQEQQLEIHVAEHLWGEFDNNNECTSSSSSPQQQQHSNLLDGSFQFDFIIGSDVAYRKELYHPLIDSLQKFAHERTTILLGCTMADTTPRFFDELRRAGFAYQRLADHLMPSGFVGQQTFGIFIVKRIR